jgi:hypothetical protein
VYKNKIPKTMSFLIDQELDKALENLEHRRRRRKADQIEETQSRCCVD